MALVVRLNASELEFMSRLLSSIEDLRLDDAPTQEDLHTELEVSDPKQKQSISPQATPTQSRTSPTQVGLTPKRTRQMGGLSFSQQQVLHTTREKERKCGLRRSKSGDISSEKPIQEMKTVRRLVHPSGTYYIWTSKPMESNLKESKS